MSDRIVSNASDVNVLTNHVVDMHKNVMLNNEKMEDVNITISENLTFIKGMGDVANAMANVLLDVTDKQNVVNKTIASIMANSQAFLNQSSGDHRTSISQKWLIEFFGKVISENSHWSETDAVNWLMLKFQDTEHEIGTRIANLPFTEKVSVTELGFVEVQEELKVSDLGMLIMRTGYMMYVCYWHAKPVLEYPYLEQWLGLVRQVAAQIEEVK